MSKHTATDRDDMVALLGIYLHDTCALGGFIAAAQKKFPALNVTYLRNIWLAFDVAVISQGGRTDV